MKATGLLALLLSFPDDWSIDHRDLARRKTDGFDSVRRCLRELEACGYLKRERIQDPISGKWGWIHTLYEIPEGGYPHLGERGPRVRDPESGKSESGFPSLLQRKAHRTQSSESGKPSLGRAAADRCSDPSCPRCGGSGWALDPVTGEAYHCGGPGQGEEAG